METNNFNMETNNLKKRPVSCRISYKNYDIIKQICDEYDKTMSDVLEQFIDKMIQNFIEWKQKKQQNNDGQGKNKQGTQSTL